MHIFVFARRRGVLWNKIALLTLARLSLRADADGRWQHPRLLCLRSLDAPCAQTRMGVSGIVSLIIAIPPLFARRCGGP